jgi:hypothetical protein
MRKRLNLQFPGSEAQFCALPTDTVLELGKKSNSEFLEQAIIDTKKDCQTVNGHYRVLLPEKWVGVVKDTIQRAKSALKLDGTILN